MDKHDLILKADVADPGLIFSSRDALEGILEGVRIKVSSYDVEVETPEGRKECASLARKIASSKVFLDNAGKEYVSKLKAKIKPIDALRRHAKQTLDALRDEVRAPLTEWEQEQERIRQEEEAKAQKIADHVEALQMDAVFNERREFERKQKELQAQIEENNRIAAELKRKQELEQARIQAKADAERQAREQADLAVRMEREKLEEQARQAELKRIEAEEKVRMAELEARRAEEDRLRKEQEAQAEKERLAKDQANRERVHGDIRAALEAIGVTTSAANFIVRTIATGKVPHVRIDYGGA